MIAPHPVFKDENKMAAKIRQSKTPVNFNLFIDGEGYAGLATSLTLPAFSIKTEDTIQAGMEFNRKRDYGLEDPELTFKFLDYNGSLQRKVAIKNGSNTLLIFKSTLTDDEGPETEDVTAWARGHITKLEIDEFTAGGKVENSYTMALKYYRHMVNGVEIHEIDNDNYVRKIAGVDYLANQRGDLWI